MKQTLHIHLLGDFLLLLDNTPITTLTVPRLQSLLTYLLIHRSAPQNRAHLAFLLWPDSTEPQARTNLRKALHQLRQAFPEIENFLYADSHSLQWAPTQNNAFSLDLEQLEQALAQVRQAEQVKDMTMLRQALEQVMHLYRGDLLPSCYEEWLLPERERWRKSFITAAERLITLLEEEQDYDEGIATAQQLLYHDPLHEATYRHLMRLYAAQGNRAAALRVYHTCVTTLERELGIGPGGITQEVYESLIQSPGSSRPAHEQPPVRSTQAPLIGRKTEWQQLQAAWRKAVAGQQQVVLLSGEAGIGKTRLAEEMIAWVERQDMPTASAHCYATEGRLAYAPVTAWLQTDILQANLSALDTLWLTELARCLPNLLIQHPKLPRPGPMTEGWQRRHFFEALAHAVLSTRQPLLLFLDDLQWCDNETLDWLHYLLHVKAATRLLLIGTVRSEEILPGHPLVPFMNALQRDGLVTEIALEPLNATETATLTEHIVGSSLDSTWRTTIYTETEGNPLFVVEMAQAQAALLNRAAQEQRSSSLPLLTQVASTLPSTMQGVLMARLAQLSPLAHTIVNVAAVIGHAFPFAVLHHASGQDEDTVVQGLDELWQRRIVREQGTGSATTYGFSHDKLREMAYLAQSSAQQRLLHRRVAQSFEQVYSTGLDAVSGQIALHYERAHLPEQAIPYYRRAGEAARRIYANADALVAFQRAACLLAMSIARQESTEPQCEEIAALYTAQGDIFAATGRPLEARQAYQEGLTFVSQHASLWHARLLRKMASTWNLASDNPLDTFHSNASQLFQEAESVLEQVKEKANAQWRQEWIQLYIDQLLPLRGSMHEMTALIEKAQAMVEQHGTAEQRGQFFQAVVARDAIRDRYIASEETIMYCRKALTEVQKTGNSSLIGFAHFVLANRLWWAYQLDEAEAEMQMAMRIAERIGNTTLLARCLMFSPFISRLRGQLVEVQAIVTRALTMPEAKNTSIIKGHSAWVAWRTGDLAEAERMGLASIEGRQPQQASNAFRWAGLWPLIGVTLRQERLTDAIHWIRMLIEPTQQQPVERVRILLEAALQAWDTGKQEEAAALLLQAIPLAEQMGYL